MVVEVVSEVVAQLSTQTRMSDCAWSFATITNTNLQSKIKSGCEKCLQVSASSLRTEATWSHEEFLILPRDGKFD